jgi:DNA-binding winged helix-turn-helix (wHTH) protein
MNLHTPTVPARTVKDYRIEGVKLSIDERAGFVLAQGRAEPISPRCARFLRCIADLYKTCPKGVGSARLMRAVWGRENVKGANLQQLSRVAAEARAALRPLGFDCERFRVPGIADWPGYRVIKREVAP